MWVGTHETSEKGKLKRPCGTTTGPLVNGYREKDNSKNWQYKPLAVSTKAEHMQNLWPSNSTRRHIPNIHVFISSRKNMYKNVHGLTMHNPKLEQSKYPSTIERRNKLVINQWNTLEQWKQSTARGMDLLHTLLNERCQEQNRTYCTRVQFHLHKVWNRQTNLWY